MKFFFCVSLFVLSTISLTTIAQNNASMERSSDVEIEDGQRYYIHRVKFGETMYSICKIYDVSANELKQYNPFLNQQSLRADHVLRILLTPNNSSEYFKIHTVQAKETLYSIAQQYNITTEVLISLNPESEKTLFIGAKLYIPVNKTSAPTPTTNPQKENEKNVLSHTVQRKETLFAISNMYEVSIENIQQYNPEILDKNNQTNIKVGQVLLIPVFLSGIKQKETQPQTAAPQILCDNTLRKKKSLNIALLLPLNADQQKNHEELHRSFRFAEIYEGALIALEQLKEQGLSVNLTVIDTKKIGGGGLTQQAGIENADLIIGPVYQKNFIKIANFVQAKGTTIVSPLMSIDSSLAKYPNVFQIPVSFERQQETLLTHPQIDANSSNIVLVQQRTSIDNENPPFIQNYLSKIDNKIHRNTASLPDTFTVESFRGTPIEHNYLNKEHIASVKNISYATGLQPRDNFDMLFRVLHPQRENRIIISSQDEPFVSDILANLKAFADIYKCRITVYGNTSWQKFENLELNLFYNLKLHLATPYFIDYKTAAVKNFVQTYRKLYKTEPSQFAFQGHDIMLYFASALFYYDNNFTNCLPQHKLPLLQSSYSFSPMQTGGAYENRGVFLLRYTPWMEILEYK
ncbi:MAG: LysM peptidoglycan-binding domain-containing protein [Bacteroidales bacterium]